MSTNKIDEALGVIEIESETKGEIIDMGKERVLQLMGYSNLQKRENIQEPTKLLATLSNKLQKSPKS